MASRLRYENSSLIHYIKDQVIPVSFSEQSSSEPLVYNSAKDLYLAESQLLPSPTGKGRGWNYFDDSIVGNRLVVDQTTEQTNKVSVVGASTYTVNYLAGGIKNPDTTPTSVTYYYNYVSVIEGWPIDNLPDLPFVAVVIDSSIKAGFQLGGGLKNTRTISFHIFATSSAERDDLSELIHSYLFNRNIPILDFSGGDYLKYDGTFNTALSLPLASIGNMEIISVSQKNVYVPYDFSDVDKYRSLITATYEVYVDDET